MKKKDFSPELRTLLDEYSKTNDLDLTFQCKKTFDTYRVKIIDPDGSCEEREIEQRTVSNFFKNHDIESKKEILDIIFNPGPRITKTPGY